MLTPAQQKIRRELEELQFNGRFAASEKIDLPKKTSPRLRTFLIIGIFFLFVALIAVTGNLFKENKLHGQEMMKHYVTKELTLNLQSDQLLKSCLANIDTNQAQTKQRKLLLMSHTLSAPVDLKDHREDFLDVMGARLSVITYLNGPKKTNDINRLLNELTVKQELAKESLLQALNRRQIKYIWNADGTIQFQ